MLPLLSKDSMPQAKFHSLYANKLVQWENEPDSIVFRAQKIAAWHGLWQIQLVLLNLKNVVLASSYHTLTDFNKKTSLTSCKNCSLFSLDTDISASRPPGRQAWPQPQCWPGPLGRRDKWHLLVGLLCDLRSIWVSAWPHGRALPADPPWHVAQAREKLLVSSQ